MRLAPSNRIKMLPCLKESTNGSEEGLSPTKRRITYPVPLEWSAYWDSRRDIDVPERWDLMCWYG